MGELKPTYTLKEKLIMLTNERIQNTANKMDVLEKAGLKHGESWSKCLEEYNDLVRHKGELMEANTEDRRQSNMETVATLAGCDYLYEQAERMRKMSIRVYGDVKTPETTLAEAIQQVCKMLGSLVCVIDLPKDERFSWRFADLSEKITDTITDRTADIVREIVEQDYETNGDIVFKGDRKWERIKRQNCNQ